MFICGMSDTYIAPRGQTDWNSFQKKKWNLRIDQIMPIVPATLGLVAAYVAIPLPEIEIYGSVAKNIC